MLSLIAGQFTDFFHAVHGYEPFKWQQRPHSNGLRGMIVTSSQDA